MSMLLVGGVKSLYPDNVTDSGRGTGMSGALSLS